MTVRSKIGGGVCAKPSNDPRAARPCSSTHDLHLFACSHSVKLGDIGRDHVGEEVVGEGFLATPRPLHKRKLLFTRANVVYLLNRPIPTHIAQHLPRSWPPLALFAASDGLQDLNLHLLYAEGNPDTVLVDLHTSILSSIYPLEPKHPRTGMPPASLATLTSFSAQQVDWLRQHCSPDDANADTHIVSTLFQDMTGRLTGFRELRVERLATTCDRATTIVEYLGIRGHDASPKREVCTRACIVKLAALRRSPCHSLIVPPSDRTALITTTCTGYGKYTFWPSSTLIFA
ncbi:hypothetical protein BC629DRAFT_1444133 [Irpex lacteus]|nr:hypothetical protein BC629DRAFT_1444133 [Irpex lacteus]